MRGTNNKISIKSKKGGSKSIFFYFIAVGSVLAALLIIRSMTNIINNHKSQTSTTSSNTLHTQQTTTLSISNFPSQTQLPTIRAESLPITPKQPIRIAYIFAGSVRSFLCPKVHWSIRLHLMDALGGEGYSFIRVSTEDNKNTKTGDGVVYSPEHDERELNATLRILNPQKVEYFHLSTQDEEMANNFPSMTHRVFRKMDQRRYSMFYHRCMAYRLAKQFEEQQTWKFDWVVLVRLDAGWLEPVLPIHYWKNDRVWLTETGFVPYNDQFMLIPREFSDYLYNLDTKVRKPVYCLGGPDVERWKCNVTALTEKGYDGEFINATLGLCCSDMFTQNRLGFSETIHMRHFLVGKIPVSMGRFPVYLTRKLPEEPCYADCPRLYYNFKDFAFEFLQHHVKKWMPMDAVDTRALPISETDASRCSFLNSAMSPWQPISALEYEQELEKRSDKKTLNFLSSENSSVYASNSVEFKDDNIIVEPVNYSGNLYSQWSHLHPSLKINPLQYSTWRIHPSWNVDGCLTVNMSTKAMTWDTCNLYLRYKGGRRHDPRQAFIMNVQPHTSSLVRDVRLVSSDDEVQSFSSQPLPALTSILIVRRMVREYDLLRNLWCWTVQERNVRIPRSHAQVTKAQTRGNTTTQSQSNAVELLERTDPVLISLQECSPALYPSNAMKQEKELIDRKHELRLEREKELASRQQFITVKGEAMGSHTYTTVGRIRPAKYPDYCVVRGGTSEEGLGRKMQSHELLLAKCNQLNVATSHKFFEFEYVHS